MKPELTMLEAKRTTLYEYMIYQRAWDLRVIDARFMASYTAWQTTIAQSTDKKGKAICKTFKDLFDYDKELQRVEWKKQTLQVDKCDKEILERLKHVNRE